MEAINNVASAAAKVVWGEGDATKEPVSGVNGDVSKGEPYDAGNLDDPDQVKVEKRLSNDNDKVPDNKLDTTTIPTPPVGDTTSGQTGANNLGQAADDVPETVDPEDLKGPGPKPIAVVAKEHGGDAGQRGEVTQLAESETKETGGNVSNEGHTKDDGEDYVKTTGFSADGGNFDAKNPGAGREADRLLEQRIVQPEDNTTPANPTSNGDTDSPKPTKHSKNKPSLTERIKAKLHRH